jgi:L-lactate dehydrogenase (cytochrome)
MGARAVLIGRAYAYGLAVAGKEGVSRAIEIIREDIERTLRLVGCAAVKELDASFVRFPREWSGR